jgi:hypothetical protein
MCVCEFQLLCVCVSLQTFRRRLQSQSLSLLLAERVKIIVQALLQSNQKTNELKAKQNLGLFSPPFHFIHGTLCAREQAKT